MLGRGGGVGKSMSWGRDSTETEDRGARTLQLVVHGGGRWLFPAVVYCRLDDLMPRTGSMSEKVVQSALYHMRLRKHLQYYTFLYRTYYTVPNPTMGIASSKHQVV